MTTLGARLRAARKAAGLLQYEAANQRWWASCHVISRLERGLTTPDSTQILDLARLYGVRAEWLRTGEGPMREEDNA